MIRSRTATLSGVVASVAAIAVTALTAGQVRERLDGAYTYPSSQGLGLDDASSMTMTYLFAISGAGLIVSVTYLASRPFAASRTGWWIGSALTAMAVVVAIYNATQVFPIAIQFVYFLPAAAGVFWLATSSRRRAHEV